MNLIKLKLNNKSQIGKLFRFFGRYLHCCHYHYCHEYRLHDCRYLSLSRGSTPTVGSSKTKIGEEYRSAIAKDTRLCWPPL